ncbi:hypothetical protein R5R35_006564 [Gryllus longicercus]
MTELENLTIMATEHFQEHILPVIRYRKTDRYLTYDLLDDSFDQFIVDINTSAVFSADEQPRFGFSADERRTTTYSGRSDCANENSGGGDSAANSTENNHPPGEYAARDSTDRYSTVKNNMAESQAGKCDVSKLNAADSRTPGCSWMNEPTPKHNILKTHFSDVQKLVNDIQYLKTSLGHQSQQIGAQDSKLKNQASQINEQKAKLFKMEATLAENDRKYALLNKGLEILCNNYTKLSHTSDTTNTTSKASVPGSINLVEGSCDNETTSGNINETSGVSDMHGQLEKLSPEVHVQGGDGLNLLKNNQKLKEETDEKAGPSQTTHDKSACPSLKGVKRIKTLEESDESASE